MKLVINPTDGTITVETPDNVSAAQFVRELCQPQPQKAIEAKPKRKPKKQKALAPPRPDRPLSKPMDETWAWLAAADGPRGVTAEELANAFGITTAGALWRLNQLIKRDMAWRVSTGHYRVGSITDAEVIVLNDQRT